jgi:hypothetical protein
LQCRLRDSWSSPVPAFGDLKIFLGRFDLNHTHAKTHIHAESGKR